MGVLSWTMQNRNTRLEIKKKIRMLPQHNLLLEKSSGKNYKLQEM